MNRTMLDRARTLIGGLAFALLALCAAPAARAQSCPTTGQTAASIYINVTADCTVTGNLTATNGSVTFIANGSKATVTGTISATTDVSIQGDNGVSVGSTITASGGQLNVQATISNTGSITLSGATTSQGGVSIEAAQDVSLAAVTNTGGGDVRVFANMGASPTSDPFQIGVSGAANGVASITDNNSGGGQTIYITNGTGTGAITYSGTNILQVNASVGNAGTIVLDGRSSSNITLSGTLSADNATGSGFIDLFANAVTANSATVTANSPGKTVGYINLVTNAITVNTSLTLSINGNGPVPSGVNLSLFPVGSYSVDPPDYYLGDLITYEPYTTSSNPLAITGAGNFIINAIGNNNGVKIFGFPLSLTTATTTINQQGSDDLTDVSSSDGGSNSNTLTLGGTIAVHVNTNAAGQTTGQIGIGGTSILPSPLTGQVTLDVSGTSGGDGGLINLSPDSGKISLGGSGSNFTLNANGSSSGGKGGTINAGDGGTLAITVNSANGVQASALSGNNNGGAITISGKSLTNASGTSVKIAADASGNANGGSIVFELDGTVTFGSAATAFTAEANGAGSGKGGSVSVTGTTVTVTSPVATPAISVIAGSSNGAGGTITVNGSTISMSGGLSATGTGTGPGGIITIDSTGNLTFTGTGQVILNASGNAGAGGSDTQVNVTAHEAVTIGAATGDVQLLASNPGAGNGGNVSVTTTSGAITAAGADINVSAGTGNGKGGTITLNAKGALTTSGTLNASGTGSGQGGSLSITSGAQITGGSASLTADGGSSGGSGGSVNLSYKGSSTITLATLSAASSTTGGTITVVNGNNASVTLSATTLRTANVANPSVSRGTTTIHTNTDTSDNITITAPTTNTNLFLDGEVVSVTATAASNIGLGTTTGQTSVTVSAAATGSTIEVLTGDTVLVNGTTLSLKAPAITLDSDSSLSVMGTGSGKNIGFTTSAVNFQSGAVISVPNGSVAILGPSSASTPLVITVPSGSSVQGVTAATSFIINNNAGVTLSGGGELQFVNSGTIDTSAIEGNTGPIVDNGVTLVSSSALHLGLSATSIATESSPLLTDGVVELQATSGGGGTYVTESGTQALTLDESSATGAFTLVAGGSITATDGLRVGATSPLEIAAGQSLTFGSSTTTVSGSTITLTAGQGALAIQNGTNLATEAGTLLIYNTSSSGTISLGSGTYSSSGSQSGGFPGLLEVAVGSTGVETNLDPLNRPSNVSVLKNSYGQIYWGPTPGITASGATSSFDVSGNSGSGLAQVVFNSPSGLSAITLNGITVNVTTLP